MVRQQVTNHFLPGLKLILIPVAVILAGCGLDKGILDAASDATIWMLAPDILRVVGHRSASMAVPNIVLGDPLDAYIAILLWIENDLTRLDIGAHTQHLLLLRVVDLEDHMRVIKCHAVGHAACLDQLCNLHDPTVML